MPVVPTYEDRGIRLDPGLNFRDNTHATGEMFGSGIGTALGTAGKGLTDIGQAVSDAAIAKEKARADAAKATPDLASVENEAAANVGVQRAVAGLGRLKNGDGGAPDPSSLMGTGPVNTFLQHQAEVDKVVKAARDSVLPAAQPMFDEKFAPILYDAKKQELEAQAEEQKSRIREGYEAGANTFKDQAVQVPTDEKRYQGFVGLGLKQVEKYGYLHGWKAEQTEQAKADYLSDTRKRATLALAETDALAALNYSIDHAADLSSADKMALYDAMQPGLTAAMKRAAAHTSLANPAPDQFAAVGLPPSAYVLLGAIGQTEAPSYDAQSGGGRFGDFSKHPGMVGFGGTSTKAGRYGLDGSTWERIAAGAGLADFSPASQDRGAWALAQKNYRIQTNRSLEEDIKLGRWAVIRENLAPTWAGLAKLSDEDFAKLAGWPTPGASQSTQAGGIGSDAAASTHAAPLPPLAPSLQAPTARLSPATEALLSKLPPAQAEELRKAGFAGVLEAEQNKARADAVEGATRAEAYRQRIESGDKTLTPRDIDEDVVLKADQKAELRGKWEAKNQEVVETDQNVDNFTTGELKFDGYSEANQVAVDRVWERVSTWGDTPEKVLPLLNGLIRQTGIVPSQVIRDIRQGFASKDPATVLEALLTLDRLMAGGEEAVLRSRGGEAIDNAILDFRYKIGSEGLSPEQAVASYIEDNDPTKRVVVDQARITYALGKIRPQDVMDLFNERGGDLYIGFIPEQHEESMAEYKEIFRREFEDTGDFKRAKARADEKFKRIYGVTHVTGQPTIMKYPPEKYNKDIGGSIEWMTKQYLQLVDYIRRVTNDPNIQPYEVILVPKENAAALVASGKAPIYRVFVVRRGEDRKLIRTEVTGGQGFAFNRTAALQAMRLDYVNKKLSQRDDQQEALEQDLPEQEYFRQATGLPPESPPQPLTAGDIPESEVREQWKREEDRQADEQEARNQEAAKGNYYYLATEKPKDADIGKQNFQPTPKVVEFGEPTAEPRLTMEEERQRIADKRNSGLTIGMQGHVAATAQQIENLEKTKEQLEKELASREDAGPVSGGNRPQGPWILSDGEASAIPKEPRPAASSQSFPEVPKLLDAIMRQTSIGAANSNKRNHSDDGTVELGFDPIKEIVGTKYEPYIEEALNIFNRKDFEAWKAQIDMQEEDQRIIEASGWVGAILGIAADFADPVNYIPAIGPMGRAYRVGKHVIPALLADALVSAANEGGKALLQKALVDASQERQNTSGYFETIFRSILKDATWNAYKATPEGEWVMDWLKKLDPR